MSTSIYFPPGWNKERLLNASSDELLELSNSERIAMYDSLKASLGSEGFQSLLREMSNRYKARLAAENPSSPNPEDDLSPEIRAPFLATLKRIYPGDSEDWGEWGFAVFRTTFGEDEKWAALRLRWDEIVEERLKNYDGVPGVDKARRLLRFHWVEDSTLAPSQLQKNTIRRAWVPLYLQGQISRRFRRVLLQIMWNQTSLILPP